MTTEQSYFVTYIGKKCNIDMTDGNDGVYESYLLGQVLEAKKITKIETIIL